MSPFARSGLTLLGVGAAAAGLGLYAYFGVMKPDQAKERHTQTEERLFNAPVESAQDAGAAAELVSLTVEAKGEHTALTKSEGRWRLTEPVDAAADRTAVEGLLTQLQTAKFKRIIEEQPTPQDLKKYGLAPPRFLVRATARLPGGGSQEVLLRGGIENPFDASVYLQREGDPRVYAAEGGVRWSLEKTTFDLRDKEVLALEEAKVASLEVKTRTHLLALARADATRWTLTQPTQAAADGPAVAALFTGLRQERATAFLKDSPEERKALGFEAPAVDATFTRTDGPAVRLRLAERGMDGGVKQAFALREGGGPSVLAEVAPGALVVLGRTPAAFKDKAVLSFKKEDVARVTFAPGGKGAPLIVERVRADAGMSEDWRVLAPQEGPARKFKLTSVLWLLQSLKASTVLDAADLRSLGLGPGARAVSLYDAQGKPIASLALGKEVPAKPGMLYAKGSASAAVEIDGTRVAELPTNAADVLDGPADAGVGAR